MHPHPFEISAIARSVWEDKYRLAPPGDDAASDKNVEDTFRRVGVSAASVEPGGAKVREAWAETFYEAMADFSFLPAGRIVAGAGTQRNVTLFNCFVMGEIEDDLGAIFQHLRQSALTLQTGGGIGVDFSTLRPQGALVRSIGADASGPVSFMDVWDSMCRTIMSAGARRGAMMGTLRCDHPDIELFIEAKSDPQRLRNFNLSVLVTDAFMAAVRDDRDWPLSFGGEVVRSVKARDLWERLMRATYHYAEPGVIFVDRINARNNLNYCETISATNPCGEQPLPPYGACLLGSINLARLIERPFSPDAGLDAARLEELVRTAVRLLDNVIDVSKYALDRQRDEAHAKRRIGLGITGLADALIFCGLRYNSDTGRHQAGRWMAAIQDAAYRASAELAQEKGTFALYDGDAIARSPNVAALSRPAQNAIAKHGLRNGCLTSIAPTGTISLLAGNVSSGIEPVFATHYSRRVLQPDGSARVETVADYAAALHEKLYPDKPLPETFVTANDIDISAHLEMQSTLQANVDSSISKTINCPQETSFEAFKDVYVQAFDLGLKGCTTFRPNEVTGSVLSAADSSADRTGGREDGSDEAATTESCSIVATDANGAPAAAHTTPASPTLAKTVSAAGGVVQMTEPLDRDPALAGFTYKLKWPGSAHAIYVTINDIEHAGRQRPFEIFINTKNLDHQAWTVALTRMISAVFRRGGDVSFVVEELKAIFDPQGGQWLDGRYVPSLQAAIGDIIERHMVRTGFLAGDATRSEITFSQLSLVGGARERGGARIPSRGVETPVGGQPNAGRVCPQCGSVHFHAQEGCWICAACGYSQCG